jgi:GT2 family glycosyltransferase
MHAASADVTISIVTYNSADTIENCLASLEPLAARGRAGIYVIDNGSTDRTAEIVRERFPWVSLIQNSSNRYFTAHNAAIAQARGRYVVILNPDVRMAPEDLDRMAAYLDGHPDVVGLAPAHRLPGGGLESIAKRRISPRDALWMYTIFQVLAPRLKQALYRKINPPEAQQGEEPIEVEVVQDSCTVFRTAPLQQAGGLCEQFMLYFTEDDICYKLRRYGRILYWPGVQVEHQQSTSVRKEPAFRIRKIRYLDMLTYLKLHFGMGVYLMFLPITYVSMAAWWMAALLRRFPQALRLAPSGPGGQL